MNTISFANMLYRNEEKIFFYLMQKEMYVNIKVNKGTKTDQDSHISFSLIPMSLRDTNCI
jgi:hypothetical protein